MHDNGAVHTTTTNAPAAGEPIANGEALRRDAWRRMRPAGPVTLLQGSLEGWDAGAASADGAVDAGAGVLLIIDTAEPGPAALALTALYCGGDASTVTSAGLSDLEWMQRCALVRDEMARLRPLLGDVAALLRGDQALAALISAILQAATRRTPVVIGGVRASIAALCAQRVAATSTSWVHAAIGDDDAAGSLARKRLGLIPWCTVSWSVEGATMQRMARLLVDDLDGVEPGIED